SRPFRPKRERLHPIFARVARRKRLAEADGHRRGAVGVSWQGMQMHVDDGRGLRGRGGGGEEEAGQQPKANSGRHLISTFSRKMSAVFMPMALFDSWKGMTRPFTVRKSLYSVTKDICPA